MKIGTAFRLSLLYAEGFGLVFFFPDFTIVFQCLLSKNHT